METVLSRLHYELVYGLIHRGVCPTNSEISASLRSSVPEVESLLLKLEAIHGVVLHPHACEPWVVHPVSTTPTLNWVEGRHASWWAPCIWCAFGIATLAAGEVRIHTRYAAEGEPLIIAVYNGQPVDSLNTLVHFAVPAAHAWDNVHRHCALLLPFHSDVEIDDWCRRHRQPRGEAVSLTATAELARAWYGTHARRDWHKWSVAEAQQIFHGCGLRSAFWNLNAQSGTESGAF